MINNTLQNVTTTTTASTKEEEKLYVFLFPPAASFAQCTTSSFLHSNWLKSRSFHFSILFFLVFAFHIEFIPNWNEGKKIIKTNFFFKKKREKTSSWKPICHPNQMNAQHGWECLNSSKSNLNTNIIHVMRQMRHITLCSTVKYAICMWCCWNRDSHYPNCIVFATYFILFYYYFCFCFYFYCCWAFCFFHDINSPTQRHFN